MFNYFSKANGAKRCLATTVASAMLVVVGFAQGGPLLGSTPTALVNDTSITKKMGVEQNLGGKLPMSTPFKDEDGKDVKLGDFFGQRPVLVIPMFYNCQTGCAVITDSVLKTLAQGTKHDQLIVGRDLDVLMFSIHPKEGPDLAKSKKALIMRAYERPGAEKSWHLLTGTFANNKKFTDALGFSFSYDEAKNLINHPVCTVIVTPDGRISSYTIGQNFPTKLIESDLEVAKKNQIGERADQTMMFGCIMIDPATGARTVNIERVVRIFMGLMLVFTAGWIAYLTRKYRHVS